MKTLIMTKFSKIFRACGNPNFKIYGEIIIFGVFTSKITLGKTIEKNNFHRKHPKYVDFVIIGDFLKKHSIDSNFQSENKF